MTHLRFPWQPRFEFLFVSLVFVATYNLSIKVGDVKGSGTDGNVYIQLFGERGNTAKIQLRQAGDARNKFEKGRTYKFTVDTVDIGKVSIKLTLLRCALIDLYVHMMQILEYISIMVKGTEGSFTFTSFIMYGIYRLLHVKSLISFLFTSF